jgi:uncharacterized protein (DUF1499 family)
MKSFLQRIALGLLVLMLASAALAAIEYFGGQPMGLFSGSRPTDLGFKNGKFAAPSWKPNVVSSTVDKSDQTHYIEPLRFSGDAEIAWSALFAVAKTRPRVRIVSDEPGYMHAEFKSARMGFVDDVEFALDAKAGVIHVRSASRLGIRDFGVNRERIESLRAQLKP